MHFISAACFYCVKSTMYAGQAGLDHFHMVTIPGWVLTHAPTFLVSKPLNFDTIACYEHF